MVPLARSPQTVGVAVEGAVVENHSNWVAEAGGGEGLPKTARAGVECSNRIKTAADAEWDRHRVGGSVSHHLTATLISLSRLHHLTVKPRHAFPHAEPRIIGRVSIRAIEVVTCEECSTRCLLA